LWCYMYMSFIIVCNNFCRLRMWIKLLNSVMFYHVHWIGLWPKEKTCVSAIETHYGSHASETYVPSYENSACKTMKVLLNCFAYYMISNLLGRKNLITIFIISLYIHDIRSIACDQKWDFFKSPTLRHISSGYMY
jgi:hypothetical protein